MPTEEYDSQICSICGWINKINRETGIAQNKQISTV